MRILQCSHICAVFAHEFPDIHVRLHWLHRYSPKQRPDPWYGVFFSPDCIFPWIARCWNDKIQTQTIWPTNKNVAHSFSFWEVFEFCNCICTHQCVPRSIAAGVYIHQATANTNTNEQLHIEHSWRLVQFVLLWFITYDLVVVVLSWSLDWSMPLIKQKWTKYKPTGILLL